MKVLDLDLLLPKDAEIIWQGKTWFLPADLPSKQALVVISLQEELTRGKISAYREVIKLYTELLKIKNTLGNNEIEKKMMYKGGFFKLIPFVFVDLLTEGGKKSLNLDETTYEDVEIKLHGKNLILPGDLIVTHAFAIMEAGEQLASGNKQEAYKQIINSLEEIIKIKNEGIKTGVLADLSFKQLMELIVFVSKEILGGIITEDEDIEKKTLTEMEKNKEI